MRSGAVAAVVAATAVAVGAAGAGAGARARTVLGSADDAPPSIVVSAADRTGFAVDIALAPAAWTSAATDAGDSDTTCGEPDPTGRMPGPIEAEPHAWLIGVPGGPDGVGAEVDVVALEEVVVAGPAGCGGPPSGVTAGSGAPVRASRVAVRIEPAGMLRHQPIARLVFEPVAPAGGDRLRVRARARARIRYTAGAAIDRAPLEPAPIEGVLGHLLNHRFLPRRTEARPVPAGAGSGLPATLSGTGSGGHRPAAPAGPGADRGTRDRRPAPPVPRGDPRPLQAAPGPAAADPDALKVGVDRDGPVAVTGVALAAAGWDLAAVDPGTLALEAAGRPVGLAVDDGGDGRLDPADRLVFHGRGMTGPYTRENVYWLRRSGVPTRSAARTGAPDASAPAAPPFRTTLHAERDTEYFVSMRAGEGDDRWMWGPPLSASVTPPNPTFTTTLALPNLAPAPDGAALRVRLQGFASDPRVAPDHHFEVRIDGTRVAEAWFDGPGVHVIEAALPPGTLTGPTHTLTVTSLGDTGAVVDSVFVNRIALDHAAGYRAVGDRLDFAAPHPGRHTFTLTGFGSPDVRVVDVTVPDQPVAITGIDVAVSEEGAGTYRARFSDTATAETRYVAFTPAGILRPTQVARNTPSAWRTPARGADYVVVTHPDFAAAVDPLVWHRAAQGLRTATVLIDDVYDEFSGGVFDPRAIRTFLAHAFAHWPPPAPTYVLLVGESNLDYRRGYGQGPPNFVPSIQFDTTSRLTGDMGAATSDLWFAAVSGDDDVPDMLLGRLSVSTAAQAEAVVAKTLRHEAAPPGADWRRRVVLVADDDGADLFEPFSDTLARLAPPDTVVERFYAARHPRDRNLAADIGAAVDAGALALNFTGHGNVDLWSPWPGGGRIFQNADIARLANGDRMPLFTAATCMNGWIDHPLKPVSMAELWLTHPAGGGVAAWSPSGLATLSAQRLLLPSVYRGLFDGRRLPIGALTTAASVEVLAQGGEGADIARMFVLLGDPAVVIAGASAAPTATAAPTVAATATASARPPSPAVFLPAVRRE